MTRAGHLSNIMAHGAGPRPNRSRQRRGPLRKITETIRYAANMFDTNLVRLECGHITGSNGIYRARCARCKRDADIPQEEAR